MLSNSLPYFSDYKSIVQVYVHVNELSKSLNYSDDILFTFLDNELYADIGKSLVDHLKDKHLLESYIDKFIDDKAFVDKLFSYNVIFPTDLFVEQCCRYGYIHIIKHMIYTDQHAFATFIIACKLNKIDIVKCIFEEHIHDTEEFMNTIFSTDIILHIIVNEYNDIFMYIIDNDKYNSRKPHFCYIMALTCKTTNIKLAKHVMTTWMGGFDVWHLNIIVELCVENEFFDLLKHIIHLYPHHCTNHMLIDACRYDDPNIIGLLMSRCDDELHTVLEMFRKSDIYRTMSSNVRNYLIKLLTKYRFVDFIDIKADKLLKVKDATTSYTSS